MFKKYSSIENSYRQKYINKIQMNIKPDSEFVVTEKVHGANFSIYVSGNGDIKCAKRTAFLKEGEQFYNHDVVLQKLSKKVLDMFWFFKSCFHEELVICGEICGGSYPHESVDRLNVKKVQRGVFYSNDIEFIAFDIRLDGEYINHNNFIDLCEEFGIMTAPEVFRGSLTDCLNYTNEYQTKVPDMLGLPTIDNNICEGNVIKPLFPKYLPNGNRVIIKNKNNRFSEKQKSETVKKDKTLPEHIQSTINDMQQFVNDNRLRNVLSKIGSVSQKDFGKVLGLFVKDILEDFSKEYDSYDKLEDSEKKTVNKNINKLCANHIRTNFMNIVDGEF